MLVLPLTYPEQRSVCAGHDTASRALAGHLGADRWSLKIRIAQVLTGCRRLRIITDALQTTGAGRANEHENGREFP
jgi:hypothetical protein